MAERFCRQEALSGFGEVGQARLARASVLVVGAGGLGSAAALHLCKLGLVDGDSAELINLHRQILHCEDAIGMNKAESAARELRKRNSTINMELHRTMIRTYSDAVALIGPYDVVLDCTDSMEMRYVLGDACVHCGIPLVAGDALAWEGQLTVYNYNGGPCLRCIYPNPPEARFVKKCKDVGVFPPVVSTIGTLQAGEAVKILIGQPVLSQKLLLVNGRTMSFRTVALRPRQPNCLCCGSKADSPLN